MTASENEIFATLKSSVLDENRMLLCSNLEPKLHYPYLRSKRVLSKDDEEEIESQPQTKLKVHKFLDVLIQRSMGYDHLVKSIIQERTQIFLAEKLNKEFEEKKKRLTALLAEQNQDNRCLGIPIGGSIQTSTNLASIKHQMDPFPQVAPKDSCYFMDSAISELDSLPKPVLSNNNTIIYGGNNLSKISAMASCENSLHEDSTDNESLADSVSTGCESKA